MKYGLLKYSEQIINLGDYIQMEGIRQAYKRLGIKKEDIVEVERGQLRLYEGDYVILPMTGVFFYNHDRSFFPLSPKIIPIFIGFHTCDESIAAEIAKYQRFGPFGCRDLVTKELMEKQGVSAYMSGCFSIGYERRQREPENGKVYLCDPPEELRPYIPDELLKESIELPSPVRTMPFLGYSEENEKMAKDIITNLLEELKANARLVITRRLHMALPCIAMGIPVVLAHVCADGDVEEARFAGLDKIVRVYKPKEFDSIDWNPKVPDIEWLKEKIIQLAMQRIREVEQQWRLPCELSEYYESTENQIYYGGMKASYLSEQQKTFFMQNSWKMERTIFEFITKKHFEKMHLVFYGAGDKCRWAVRRYRDYIGRVKKFYILDGDEKKQGKSINEIQPPAFWDFQIPGNIIVQEPQVISSINKENLVLVVTCDRYYSGAGAEIGNALMKEYDLTEGKELFFLDKLNSSMDMHMSCTSTPSYWLHGF